jgi:hypothetical protein
VTDNAESVATELVDANRILAHFGLMDAFGHVSARTAPDRFLLSRNLAPAQVTRDDLLDYTLDCEQSMVAGINNTWNASFTVRCTGITRILELSSTPTLVGWSPLACSAERH